MARYLYSELASTLDAYKRCISPSANESQKAYADIHEERIEKWVKDLMPSGSGFDCGTKLDFTLSHANKLVFTTEFHHMNENGYDGWTSHTVTVTPSFSGFDIRISGRNRNDIKEHIHEAFDYSLMTDVTYDVFLPRYPQFAVTGVFENFDGTPSKYNRIWYVGEPSEKSIRYMSYTFARKAATKLMEDERNGNNKLVAAESAIMTASASANLA